MAIMDEAKIRSAIFAILTDIAPEVSSPDELDSASNLREQVDLDSMDFLNLVTGIASQFQIEISEQDYGRLVSFDDLVAYVSAKQKSAD
jgi:acyl carrier protein